MSPGVVVGGGRLDDETGGADDAGETAVGLTDVPDGETGPVGGTGAGAIAEVSASVDSGTGAGEVVAPTLAAGDCSGGSGAGGACGTGDAGTEGSTRPQPTRIRLGSSKTRAPNRAPRLASQIPRHCAASPLAGGDRAERVALAARYVGASAAGGGRRRRRASTQPGRISSWSAAKRTPGATGRSAFNRWISRQRSPRPRGGLGDPQSVAGAPSTSDRRKRWARRGPPAIDADAGRARHRGQPRCRRGAHAAHAGVRARPAPLRGLRRPDASTAEPAPFELAAYARPTAPRRRHRPTDPGEPDDDGDERRPCHRKRPCRSARHAARTKAARGRERPANSRHEEERHRSAGRRARQRQRRLATDRTNGDS